jgi:RHS repeat-associated protein
MKLSTTYIPDNVFCSQNVASAIFGEDGECCAGEYRFGFNGMERENEFYGAGNTYDFGARILDVRIGRWMSVDPKVNKFPFESSFCFVSNNPNIYKDPTGEEKIIVIGGKDKVQSDDAKFVNSGLLQLKNYINDVGNTGEQITVIITNDYMTEKMMNGVSNEIKHIVGLAELRGHIENGEMSFYNYNVNIETVSTDSELVNYFNSKSKFSSNLSNERTNDKITSVSIFGHGLNGGRGFTPGYPLSTDSDSYGVNNNLGISDLSNLNSSAFNNSLIGLYMCNAATNSNGTNFAKELSKATKSNVYGWEGQTSYSSIYNTNNKSTYQSLSNIQKVGITYLFPSDKFNLMIRPASNLPTGGNDVKPNKVTYSNGDEIQRETTK